MAYLCMDIDYHLLSSETVVLTGRVTCIGPVTGPPGAAPTSVVRVRCVDFFQGLTGGGGIVGDC